MRPVHRDIILAWSLGSLCHFRFWYHATRFFDHSDAARTIPIYGNLSFPSSGILALFTVSGLTGVLIFLILWFGRRPRTLRAMLVSHLCLLPFLFSGANSIRIAAGDYRISAGFFIAHAGYYGFSFAVAVGICFFLYLIKNHQRIAIHLLRAPAILATPLCLFYLVQGLYLLANESEPAKPVMSRAPKTDIRVVVLLFDRVGSEQIAAFPQSSISQFKKEASEFTNTHPPAGYTSISVPALISGRQSITPLRHRGNRDFDYLGCERQTVVWNEATSLFGKANALGLSSKLIGWYLPYPTMVRKSGTSVIWFPHYAELRNRFSEDYAENLLILAKELLVIRPQQVAYHIENFLQLDRLARGAAADPAYDLVFNHYPIPHDPIIYDKNLQQMSADMPSDAYLENNMALMGRVLGTSLQAMRDSGVYERTAVIVLSDHGVYEDPVRENHHIPFLVKLPFQRVPAQIDTAFNSLLLSDLIEGVFEKKITHESSLKHWAKSREADSQSATKCFLRAFEDEKVRGITSLAD